MANLKRVYNILYYIFTYKIVKNFGQETKVENSKRPCLGIARKVPNFFKIKNARKS